MLSILFYLLQVGECKFSKLNTIVKDGVTYLVLPMGALCDEGQLKSVVQFAFCDSGQFLSDLTLGDPSLVLSTYLELLLIAWTAFAFQANFMYKAVV